MEMSDMGKQVHFWIDKCAEMEQERNKWIDVAKRLVNPYHDPNCEYAAPCTYCMAIKQTESTK